MSISDAIKIDKSFKFVLGKSYTTTQKSVDNEDAPSGFIIGGASVFSQDAAIPTTAPGVSSSVLGYYGDGTNPTYPRFTMIYDISSPLNQAWYASTNGTNLTTMRATRVPNWIPPTFGNYTVRLFLTHGSSTTNPFVQEIFFSDATSPVFDYKSGILTFTSDPLAAYAGLSPTPDGIQISGYTYTGILLSQIFDGNGNFTGGLSDFGTSTSIAKFVNPTKTLLVSSQNSAFQSSWISQNIDERTFGIIVPKWNQIAQMPNGTILAAGTNVATSKPYVGISYGDGYVQSWYLANFISGVPNTSFSSIWAADNSNAYTTDTAGNLFTTNNGGQIWASLASVITANGIWGTSSTNFYLVGASGVIKRTVDGYTFSTETSGTSNTLYSVHGSSSSNVYISGATGTILHSTGAGTWTAQTSGTSNALRAIFVLNSTNIFAVGDSSTILKSTGAGTWASFATGIPGSFNATGIWGYTNTSSTQIFVSGLISGTLHIYVSDGTGAWTSSATFTASSIGTNMIGGQSGIYVPYNNDSEIAFLPKAGTLDVEGNSFFDGYISVGTQLDAKAASIKLLNITGQSFFTTSSTNIAISVNALDFTSHTILTGFAFDKGEGFRLWRESSTVYTLDLGSKVSSSGDGVTPTAAGGRIRLGGFTTSPSTTARGEIETVTSAALRVLAYQSDLILSSAFGISGSSIGNVNITTVNGQISLTAVGSGSPTHAGEINLTPGTNQGANVNLSTNTTASSFNVLSPGGNFNKLFGDGSFTNNSSINAGTRVTAGTSVVAGTVVTAGTFVKGATGIITGTIVSPASSGNIEADGDIICRNGHSIINLTGPIIAQANYMQANGDIVSTNGNVKAQDSVAEVFIGAAVFVDGLGNTLNHYGLHFTNAGITTGYCTSWGSTFAPGSSARAGSATFGTAAIFGARVPGISSATVYLDINAISGSALSVSPFIHYINDFGCHLEWTTAAGTTGFQLFGHIYAT